MSTLFEFAEPTEEQLREAFLRTLDTVPGFNESDPASIDAVLDVYLEALAGREREMQRNAEVADRRKAMIDLWLADANRTHEREAAWLRHMIETIAAQYDFGKKKSRTLPAGTFGYRSKPATLEIVDMAAAVAFAEAHQLEVKRTVGKTPLLQAFKASGIVPDGTEYVEGSESFYVKVGQ